MSRIWLFEAKQLMHLFQPLTMLVTPPLLSSEAAELGQPCRQKNITVHSLDLLIAMIAIHHGADVFSFDDDFQRIAGVSKLRMRLLRRVTP